MIYMAQDCFGSVKIGYTRDGAHLGLAGFPEYAREGLRARLSALRSSTSGSINLIRVLSGERPTERWLHCRFEKFSLTGEWFQFTSEMLTVVPPDEIPVRCKPVVSEREPGETSFEALERCFAELTQLQR